MPIHGNPVVVYYLRILTKLLVLYSYWNDDIHCT